MANPSAASGAMLARAMQTQRLHFTRRAIWEKADWGRSAIGASCQYGGYHTKPSQHDATRVYPESNSEAARIRLRPRGIRRARRQAADRCDSSGAPRQQTRLFRMWLQATS